MRIGIDLGGTKIEALALADDGRELGRIRVPTPRDDYEGTVHTIAHLCTRLEQQTGQRGSVGVGIPGTISARTGLVKNANSVWLNGRPLDRDLARALGRPVRLANDANCLAVSEATDGAAAGHPVVFAVILGTGTGAGVALGGRPHAGRNGVGGEWGHNPLPWATPEEFPGPECYCGKRGCLETWVSGPGFENDYEQHTGTRLRSSDLAARAEAGVPSAVAALQRYVDRLARGLAHVIDILDPDVIVLGGGMSNVAALYRLVPEQLPRWVFGGEADTPLRPALHGDSSGIRGAAWLWRAGEDWETPSE
ncbi:fructokinase [Archangium sp.]|uniref:fructokinase n=1 Tax=Archangium sp. TaxID=1872627 RepID=UPI00389A4459